MARLRVLLGIVPILIATSRSTAVAGRSVAPVPTPVAVINGSTSLLSPLTLHKVAAAEPSAGVTYLVDTKGFAVYIEQPFLTVTTVTRTSLTKDPTQWHVEVILTSQDSQRIEAWTHSHPSSQIAAVANDQVLSTIQADSNKAPGTLLLSDYFSEPEARTITKLLVGG